MAVVFGREEKRFSFKQSSDKIDGVGNSCEMRRRSRSSKLGIRTGGNSIEFFIDGVVDGSSEFVM